MKAGTHQTHSLPRIVIVGERGGLGISWNRLRKMVSSIFIGHTYQPLFQPLLYQVATGN
jgi:hypothetical protein